MAKNKSFKRINGPYVQIIHINGNHWVTIAGIHCSLVKFYDSKYRSLSEDAIEQIALITQPSHNFIKMLIWKLPSSRLDILTVVCTLLHLPLKCVMETIQPVLQHIRGPNR